MSPRAWWRVLRGGAPVGTDHWTLEETGAALVTPDAATAELAALGLTEAPRALPVRPSVVLAMDLDAPTIAWLGAAVSGMTLLRAATEAQALPLLPDAHALLGWSTPAMRAAATRVGWIQSYTAGVERLLTDDRVRDGRITVTTMSGVAAPVIAEHALALLLALVRRLDQPTTHAERERQPSRRLRALEGSTVLVVGFGHVGRRVAAAAHALGCRVLACRAGAGPAPAFVERMLSPADLGERLPQVDAVVNALPLTPATDRFFEATRFARCQRGALFVNVGRGGTVDSLALAAALHSGQIGGAGLDVADPEPLPRHHPLRRAPNLLMTPHEAGFAPITRRRELLLLRENLRRAQAGAPLLSYLDPARGY